MPSTAIDPVAAAWARLDVPGVLGPRDLAVPCAERLATLKHRAANERTAERLFRLDEVIDLPSPAGNARLARDADADLLASWFDAFVEEANIPAGRNSRREIDDRIANHRLYVWETDHRPVSLVGHTVTVAGVSRVGPVYTPPERRGRGFARALVAAVSRARLDAGDSACCLFTDLSNPVSNAIYQQVGYRPVADYAQIDLLAMT
jgi:predicted GNAT family acetyltransferase